MRSPSLKTTTTKWNWPKAMIYINNIMWISYYFWSLPIETGMCMSRGCCDVNIATITKAGCWAWADPCFLPIFCFEIQVHIQVNIASSSRLHWTASHHLFKTLSKLGQLRFHQPEKKGFQHPINIQPQHPAIIPLAGRSRNIPSTSHA